MGLHQDGLDIIEKLKLLENLSQFGEVHLVGNMAFRTTIKPDIDIQIYPNTNFEIASEQIKDTLTELGVANVIIRKLKISKKTLVLGKYKYNGVRWNVDIALTNQSDDYLYDSYAYFRDNIDHFSEEKRQLIINFKKHFCKDRIIFDNPSYYIYRGVIENNIKTTEDMAQYLEEVKEQMKKEKN